MNYNIDLIKALFSATFWLSIFLAYMLIRRRDAAGARFLSLFMVSSALWTGAVLMGLLAKTIVIKELSLAIIFTLTSLSFSFFLAFALDYINLKKWLNWKLFISLNIFPFIIAVIGFVPSLNHLLWNVDSVNATNNVSLYSFGILFWPYTIYVYSILATTLILLFRGLQLYNSFYRRQTFIFILASSFPIIFNILHVFYNKGFFAIDTTPVGFAISATIIFFGIYNFKVFELIPVARETIIETIDDSILAIDRHGRIVMHNNSYVSNFDFLPKKIIGKYLDSLHPQLYSAIVSLEEHDSNNTIEFRDKMKTFELNINQLKKRNNQLAGTVVVMHNITNRINYEQNLQISNIHLLEQLSINESLTEESKAFSGSVAHNLKSPLNAIIGFSQLLNEEQNLDEHKQRYIQTILKTSLKMSQIIDELLLFSSIGIKDISLDHVNMGTIINAALNRNLSLIKNKNAVVSLPETWPEVIGYAPWLEEAWTNLINNALKYGGNPPHLTFGFERIINHSVSFYLKDNGKGMSKDQIDQLFIPFNNFNSSLADSHGLGLSIVKKIISKLNGEIYVESENIPGEGTCFYIKLPVG